MDDGIQERLVERGRRLDQMRRKAMKDHYMVDLPQAKAKGMKVVWTPGGLATSLLDALGMQACSPEQYSAFSASKNMGLRFCDSAEAHGISPDLCAYGRCTMGLMYENDGPFGALPTADLVIHDSSICDAHAKMWDITARYYNIPSFHLDGTFQFTGTPSRADVTYRVSELKRLVQFCEDQFGVKFDYDRFKENMRNEAQMRLLLNEMQDMRKARPCPRSTRETIGDMLFVALIPHRPETVEYYQILVEDCRERVEHKIGVVPNERFRLYWDNIPVWFWLEFYEHFMSHGAVFVMDCYSNTMFNGYYSQGGRFDPEQPFESLALRQMYTQVSVGVQPTMDWYERLITDWQCDGAVFLVNRSCKAATGGRLDKTRMMSGRLGIPVMEFEGDMANPLSIDKPDVMERARVFLDALESRAAKAGVS